MIIVIMGVSGVGKTTIGKLLADNLKWEFIEADDYHSEANIQKMRHGIPLNDEDRLPWLVDINCELRSVEARSLNAVLACSALKEKYRLVLSKGLANIDFVLLEANADDIKKRLILRVNHFMNPNLLESQFNDLEVSKTSFHVDAMLSASKIISLIVSHIKLLE